MKRDNSFKKIFCVCLLFINFFSTAQVKIGSVETPIHQSAVLELSSNNKGLVLPHVQLNSITDIATVEDPKKGMLVYNTKDSGSGINKVYSGHIYFYNGVAWDIIMDKSAISLLDIPTIYAKGKRLVPKRIGRVHDFDFDLNDRDLIMNANGSIKASKKGFYKYSVSMKLSISEKQSNGSSYNLFFGLPDTGFTVRSKPTGFLLSDYTLAYSGVIFLNENQNSEKFSFSYGGATSVLSNDNHEILHQEVIWTYLGDF